MKSHFLGYYPPTATELDELWVNGLVILDTNALLNLFRYSPSTRDDFLKVLTALRDRLWLPHQVALEFHRHRLEVMDQQTEAFAEVEVALKAAQSSVAKTLQKFRRHPSLDISTFSKQLDEKIKEQLDSLAEAREEHETSILKGKTYESTFESITDLFDSKVGGPYGTDELNALYVEGAARYEAKVPPGFKDADKPEPERYGDLVLWKQILGKGSTEPRPAIFVTDDAKEDWWYKVKGRTQGARVELVDEYLAATSHRIQFYTPERFLSVANSRSDSGVSTESLNEVEEVSNQRVSRALEQLAVRRYELAQDRERLVRQLNHAYDESPEGSFAQRRFEEVQKRHEALERELRLNIGIQDRVRENLGRDDVPSDERDRDLFELGRLEGEAEALRLRLHESARDLHRRAGMLDRGATIQRVAPRLQERIMALDAQLHDVELAMSDLDESAGED